MLTGTQIAVCRELLAEHKAKQVDSSRGTKTLRGSIKRYWGGIPEPWHDACLEFLSKYVSQSNYEVVRIEDGDVTCSVPGVLGDYVFNHTMANGQPVRTNGEFFLKAVHYEINTNQWRWAIVDNNNMILMLTALTDDYIAHWVDPNAGFYDEWGFTDESGIVEPSTALPDVPEFEGQTMTMDAAEDHLMVNEYGWIVTDEAATYTVTGDIVLSSVASDDAVYGMVLDPLVDGHVRKGNWSAGDSAIEKTQGKMNANEGDWIIVQELWQEPSVYLLVGRKETDRVTEDTRLYTGVPEGEVSERVAELAQLESYAVVDVNARKTSREGVYDLFVTVVTVTDGGNYILVGQKETESATEETRLYPYIQEDLVSAKVAELAGLDGYALVDVNARRAKFDGLFDVYATVVTVSGATPYTQVGEGNTANTHEETRLYQWVREDAVSALVASLAALGSYAVVDSTASKTKYDGVFDVRVTMLSVNTGGSSFLSGKTETEYTLEETYQYPRVKQSSVSSVINGAALAGYVRIGAIARRTRHEGIYDVYVTHRQLKGAGADILVGGTGGVFKTTLKVRRHVEESAVGGIVSGLNATPLIQNVRSSKSGVDGYWDIYYSELIVPVGHTEVRNTQRFRESGADIPIYSYVNGFARVLTDIITDDDGNETEEFTYVEREYRIPTSWFKAYNYQTAMTEQIIVVAYSPTPGSPSIGDVTALSNGLFVTRNISTNYEWWGTL